MNEINKRERHDNSKFSKSIGVIDEIFKSEERKKCIGVLTTGVGVTITVFGITILSIKTK